MASDEASVVYGRQPAAPANPNVPGAAVNVGEAERTASVILGGAMAAYGLIRRGPMGAGLALLGGALLFRGASGRCALYQALGANTAAEIGPVHAESAITVDRPRAELFEFWREMGNVALFMDAIDTVQVDEDGRSHWTARDPVGRTFYWKAEVIAEKRNALITWRSLEGSDVSHTGSVRFTASPGEVTEVRLAMEFAPADDSRRASLFLDQVTEQAIHEDLGRFKRLMETGGIHSTDIQPFGSH